VTATPALSEAATRQRRAGFWIAIVGLILLTASIWAVWPHALSHDFLSFYAGASLAREGRFAEVHIPEEIFAREQEILPRLDTVVIFNRPPVYAAILAPISLIPYEWAFVCWLLAGAFVLVVFWRWAARALGTEVAVIAALYLPALLGVAHGQDCLLFLALLAGAYVCAKRDKHWLGGVLLGFGLLKFHLFLLWPVALIAGRRLKMLVGFCLTGAMLFLASLAMVGIDGLLRYAALLSTRETEILSASSHLQPSLGGLLENFGLQPSWWSTALAACLAGLALASAREANLEGFFAIVVSGSLAVAPHVLGYDATILLLPLCLTLWRPPGSATQWSARLLVSPLPWALLAFKPPLSGAAASCLLTYVVLLSVAYLHRASHPADRQSRAYCIRRAPGVSSLRP